MTPQTSPVEKDPVPEGYETIRSVSEALLGALNRVVVEGLENIPPPGRGAMVCCNHDGSLDPFFIGPPIRDRYVRGFVEASTFYFPGVRQVFEPMGMIPVPVSKGQATDPEKAQAAIRTAADAMKKGDVVVVFPEGRIKWWLGSDVLRPFKTGAVRAAALAKAPIIPCAVYGPRWVLPNLLRVKRRTLAGRARNVNVFVPALLPVKVMVRYGEPMAVDPAAFKNPDVARAETEKLRKAIFALRQDLKKRYPGPFA